MSSNVELTQISYELPLCATKEELYNCLHHLTDEDYNGNNGEEYYMTFVTSKGTKRMSRLEGAMTHYDEYDSITEFIEFVIGDCYFDPYYKDFSLFTTEVYGSLVIVLSYIQ